MKSTLLARLLDYSKSLINSVLLVTTTVINAYPGGDSPIVHGQSSSEGNGFSQRRLTNGQIVSYDDVLDLIEELEEGDPENQYAPEELERINQFVALLAREGILPNQTGGEIELESDIQELLHPDTEPYGFTYSIYQDGDRLFFPAVYRGEARAGLCKSWLAKQWKQTKKFVKKHKTAIIIGAAIVVAATVAIVVVATYGSASAAASAAGAGVAGAASCANESTPSGQRPTKRPEEERQPESESFNELAPPVQEPPTLQTTLEEQISSFKEMVVEEGLLPVNNAQAANEQSFGNKVRELGAYLAHETLDGISQVASVVPQLASEIKEIGQRLTGDVDPIPLDGYFQNSNPRENYDNLVSAGHEKIDQLFSTDQADRYSPEAKANRSNFAVGYLPPPGGLGTTLVGNTGRIAATQATSTWGWRLGQPITNRTIFGTIPKWSTVRRRYWKNQAYMHAERYHPHQVERMRGGLAPQRLNPVTGQIETMELHHIPPQREGGLFDFVELWPEEHAAADNFRHLGK